MTKDEYMTLPVAPVCNCCCLPKPDAKLRVNRYAQACNGRPEDENMDMLCKQCAHELYMDS
jgi:hypothetical protein